MVTAQNLHQLVLKLVDILELVDHDVLQPLLPLEPNVRMLLENIQGELDQVVIIQRKALLFLIEIAGVSAWSYFSFSVSRGMAIISR